jgi:hypothetical protein
MNLSLKNEWKINARSIAGRGARISTPAPAIEKPSSRLIVPRSFALSASPKAIMLNGHRAWAVKGSTQVTDVSDKLSGTSEASDILSDALAGASPHAPDPPRRRRKTNKNSKGYKFSLRMPYTMKAKLEAKAAAVESYPSAYVLKLVAADLCLPIDETQTARSRGLQEQIAALTVALNKQGGLFNQIAAALNRGQPCPVTRQEINDAWHRHTAATNAIIRLGFD